MGDATKPRLVIPAELKTEPTDQYYFNGPFISGQKCRLRLQNTGLKWIGFSLKSTNIRRFTLSPTCGPTCGAVGPWKTAVVDLTCQPIQDYQDKLDKQKNRPDRITLEWVNAPGEETAFKRDWFAINGLVRRKIFNVLYNL